MIKKKHVGRPTNEEVASRKNRKIIKFSIIAFCSIILVGGIFLFINRDNIDFSSLMGASAFKRKKLSYNCVDYLCPEGCYKQKLNTKKLNSFGYTTCEADNDLTWCDVNDDVLRVTTKNKGNINVKVYGKNKKGKTVSKTIKFVSDDITPPVCNIYYNSTKTYNYKSEVIYVTVKCNEKVSIVKSSFRNNLFNAVIIDSYTQFSCNELFSLKSKSYKRLDKFSYRLKLEVASGACSGKAIIKGYSGMFKDSAGNINVNVPSSNQFFFVNDFDLH